jgi:hypothetical protein
MKYAAKLMKETVNAVSSLVYAYMIKLLQDKACTEIPK